MALMFHIFIIIKKMSEQGITIHLILLHVFLQKDFYFGTFYINYRPQNIKSISIHLISKKMLIIFCSVITNTFNIGSIHD